MYADRIYLSISILLGCGGTTDLMDHFTTSSPWFFLGLTALLMGGLMLNMACMVRRSRTLDAEFDAGYRVGHRAGRRAGVPQLVHLDDRRQDDGRLPKVAVRALAGINPTPRWAKKDAN